ncbi:MAG: ATP-binding protein [Novosphingobium sp.]
MAERQSSAPRAGGMAGRARPWLAVAAFILLSQMLVWPLVHLAESAARPQRMDLRDSIGMIALDAQRRPIDGGKVHLAQRQQQQGYYTPLVPDAAFGRFIIPFAGQAGGKPEAIYLSLRDDVLEVRINGHLARPAQPLARQGGNVNAGPDLVIFPENSVTPGRNVAEFDVAANGSVNDFPIFAFGNAAELAQVHRVRNLMLVDLPLAGIAVCLFAALLFGLTNWPAEDRAKTRAMILLLVLSAGSTLALSYLPPSWPFGVTVGLYIVTSLGIGLSAVQYAQHEAGLFPMGRRLALALWTVLPLATAAAMVTGHARPELMPAILGTSLKLSFWFVVAACALASVLLARAAIGRGIAGAVERLILIVCLAFYALDRLGSTIPLHSAFDAQLPLTLPWSPIVGFALGLAMIASLARQAGEARDTVARANVILAERLRDQDAELARSYDAQKQMLQRQVVLEERQRIVRDMHDGIGGQLLGLMMQVRGGRFEARQVEEGLQSSIADLRLIVDSMDSADDSLAETLRSFEHRVRAQVEASGIAFRVDHGLPDDMPSPGARPTLQILRILQEAVTNALRHSGASEIALASTELADGNISITIADDGKGLPAEVKGGRGLTSMRSRAAAVNGTLDIASDAKGTALTLVVARPG